MITATPAALFDAEQLGPVGIVVNNATGWIADTFAPADSSLIRPSAAVASM